MERIVSLLDLGACVTIRYRACANRGSSGGAHPLVVPKIWCTFADAVGIDHVACNGV